MPNAIAAPRQFRVRLRHRGLAALFFFTTFLALTAARAQLITSIWIGSVLTGTGNWSNDLLWNLVPQDGHNVTINNTLFPAVVTLDVDATVSKLTIGDGATLRISNGRRLSMLGTLANDGVISLLSTGNHTDIRIESTVTITGPGTISLGDSPENRFEGSSDGSLTIGSGQTVTGAGIIGRDNLTLVNQGTIVASLTNPLQIDVRGSSFTNHGRLKATGSGGLRLADQSVTNFGMVEIGPGSSVMVSGNFTQSGSASLTRLSGGTFSAAGFALQDGTLSGSGTLSGTFSATGASIITPGGAGAAGELNFKSTVSLGSGTTVSFDLGGLTPGTGHDRINGTTIFLNGSLSLSFINGFESTLGPTDTLTLINASTALNGTFASLSNGVRVKTSDGLGSFQINYSATALTLSHFQPIPEPSTYVMLTIGVVAIAMGARRRRNGT